MGTEITIFIDSIEHSHSEATTILQAAENIGIYIPRLCYHPDLPPGPGTKADPAVYQNGLIQGDNSSSGCSEYHGCNLCLVEVEGKGIIPSCSTLIEDGMVVHTDTMTVKNLRRDNLARILSSHPHACILCSEKDGCDREVCTQGADKEERCCSNFDCCEFQAVCEYVTIEENTPQYNARNISPVDTPFFTVNPDLCTGCTRCARACEKMQGKRVIGFTFNNGEFVLGPKGPSFREAGCVFCGACVEVCPSGALMDKGLQWTKKTQLNFTPVTLPPENVRELTDANIQSIPAVNGIYQLFNADKEVILIRGTENLREDLQEKLKSVSHAHYIKYEEYAMYSMRENELLEKHLKKHGTLPEVNNEISDLY